MLQARCKRVLQKCVRVSKGPHVGSCRGRVCLRVYCCVCVFCVYLAEYVVEEVCVAVELIDGYLHTESVTSVLQECYDNVTRVKRGDC
jgi:hypothetical protein